jgi:hypothetical protein
MKNERKTKMENTWQIKIGIAVLLGIVSTVCTLLLIAIPTVAIGSGEDILDFRSVVIGALISGSIVGYFAAPMMLKEK